MQSKYMRTLLASLSLFSKNEQKKIFRLIFAQLVLTILDLLSVVLIGIIGALAVNGIKSTTPGVRSQKLLELVGLGALTIQQQVGFLAISATVFLILKTFLSYLINKKILFFLSYRSAALSTELLKKVFNQGLLGLRRFTPQETLYSVTGGVTIVAVGIIGTTTLIISDLFLIITISVGLIVVSPQTAFVTLAFFSLVILFLHFRFRKSIDLLSKRITQLSIQSGEKTLEAIATYRELIVRNRRGFYSTKIGEQRYDLANANAQQMLLPNISKYVIETSLLLGALFTTGIQFALNDAANAVANLAIFMAAGSRVAPALLRIQQSSMQIQGNLVAGQLTLDLIEELTKTEPLRDLPASADLEHKGFIPDIKISNLCFGYPGQSLNVINDLSAVFPAGSRIGIVGPSGAGKSTLVDLVLGVITPQSGDIFVSGLKPQETIEKFPGAIAYVPQEIKIINGTVKENICLGFDQEEFSEQQIWKVLTQSVLADFVRGLDEGIYSQVGVEGGKLSGGQRQRLGIARALILNPKLLVLDECTSALDREIQKEFLDTIKGLDKEITIIAISHDAEFINDFDYILNIEDRVVSIQTFDTRM